MDEEFERIMREIRRWDMGACLIEIGSCALLAATAAALMYWIAS